VVQVNGKVRERLQLAPDEAEAAAKQRALESDKVRAALGGKAPIKVIYVPGRLINIVAR